MREGWGWWEFFEGLGFPDGDFFVNVFGAGDVAWVALEANDVVCEWVIGDESREIALP